MTWTDLFLGMFVTGVTAAVTPFTVNYLSGIILTIKNKYSDTPKFGIGAWFSWSLLPNSGTVFPESVLVSKSLTACTFIDVSEGKINGRFTVTKFRWMISSAGLIGMVTKDEVKKLQEGWKQQFTDKSRIEF